MKVKMKLEQQVVSLELAKRLKKLGVKQESFWSWNLAIGKKSGEGIWYLHPSFGFTNHNAPSGRTYNHIWDVECSAFTVAELGEMLPEDIFEKPICYWKDYLKWSCHSEADKTIPTFSDFTEANARCKMLIYLLENNLLIPPPNTRSEG